MSRPELSRVSVTLPASSNEEPVTELLAAWFGQPASSYTDLALGRTTVSIYLQEKPDWSAPACQALSAALGQAQGIDAIELSGPHLNKLRSEDWAESWKRHFKPIEIGGRLLIQPGWSHKPPKAGQLNIVLDPGMSFGTGQHPTTSFCLGELVRARRPGQAQSFLDVGTGSGILAIGAAKLGYRPVHALDLDSVAVAIARGNARRNRVGHKIRFQCRDLASLPSGGSRQYAVICANLLAALLLLERNRLVALVRPGGVLAVAGVLKAEFHQIRAAYAGAGLRLAVIRTRGEWRSGLFRKQF
jgi:ribosomal protein L11 methyltransferase